MISRQNDMILDYMDKVGGITQQIASREMSCMRLPARINDLRKEGHLILTVDREAYNQFGRKIHFAEYRLIKRAGA